MAGDLGETRIEITTKSDRPATFNALLWMARSGARWRDLPEKFGPYQTAKRRYYRWIEMGRQRRGIESFFAKLKQWRRIATRYDKLAVTFASSSSPASCSG
jgi:transposase